jgi:hypothetical protein
MKVTPVTNYGNQCFAPLTTMLNPRIACINDPAGAVAM